MAMFKLLSESKLIVHILVCCFGISSWVDINGLWVELPVLVTYLPEAWTLPSYIVIVSQCANIGPVIFVILVFLCKGRKLEKPTSAFVILVGMAACLLLSFFWKRTTFLFGSMRSTALLALNFALATVDCTSSLAFVTFMAGMKAQYLPSFFFGEGLSGLIPGVIALAQGTGNVVCVNQSQTTANFTGGVWYNETDYVVYPRYETPRFSVQVFFLILFGMITVSFISFLLLNYHPYCKQEHVDHNNTSYDLKLDKIQEITGQITELSAIAHRGTESKHDQMQYTEMQSGDSLDKSRMEQDLQSNRNPDAALEETSSAMFALLLSLTFIINMQISTFLMSIQTYTSLPYSLVTYHLSAIISNIANPAACFVNLFISFTRTSSILLTTFLGSCCGAYLIVLASMSPQPPLADTNVGAGLAVTAWAMTSFLLTYSKVAIAGRLRAGGRRPMIWYGAFTQLGSFTGALAAFILVNVYHVLKDAPFC